MDFHKLQLSFHCRVCGKFCATGACIYSVAENAAMLQTAFHLPITKDREGTHPQQFCHSCYCSMTRPCTSRQSLLLGPTMIWNDHIPENCMVNSTCNNHIQILYAFTKCRLVNIFMNQGKLGGLRRRPVRDAPVNESN